MFALASLYGDSQRMPRKGFHTLRVRSVKSTRAAIDKLKRRAGEELLESSEPLRVGQFLDTAYMPASVSYVRNPKRKGETLGATIRRLRREGYPQRQAVAIAHREHGVAKPRAARRRNPSLVTFLANPGRGAQIAADVQAILYRHAKDGAYYVHVFGNQGDGDIMRSRGREYLRIDNLPARTGVTLVGHGKVLTVRHRDGRLLEKEF